MMGLCIALPVQAEFDPIILMESIRNQELSIAHDYITKNTDTQEYLHRYARIFLPAIARVANLDALTLMIEAIGKEHLKEALDYTLVAAFDNPKFSPLIQPLLTFGANPSAKVFGQTALGRAAFVYIRRDMPKGLDAARLLLKYGANPNIPEDSGMTPLMWACSGDDEPLIKLLLASGADPKLRTKQGRTASMMAGPVCTKLLAPSMPSIVNKPVLPPDEIMLQSLYQAIITNDIQQCKELLDQGVPVNTTIDNTGQSFLMKTRNADIFKILLQHGANSNWTDIKGWTTLHHLVTCPHTVELIKILLESEIELNNRISNGQNALLLTHLLFVEKLDAVSGKEILQLLIKAGADINDADKDGETLLHLAAYNNDAALAQTVLELGANLHHPNQRGETPLHLAKRLQANEVLEILAP